jgi:hypothetical protein
LGSEEGKRLGSKEDKALGSGLEQRKELSRFLTALGMKFDVSLNA